MTSRRKQTRPTKSKSLMGKVNIYIADTLLKRRIIIIINLFGNGYL